MKNLLILVLALATALALPSKEIKSRNLVVPAGQPEGRITRGQDATEKQFPFTVGLLLRDSKSNTYRCGASLINHKWVMTAAHCLVNILTLQVLLGATNHKNPELTYDVKVDKKKRHSA